MKKILYAILTFDLIIFSFLFIIVGAFTIYNKYVDPVTPTDPIYEHNYYIDFNNDDPKKSKFSIHIYGKSWQLKGDGGSLEEIDEVSR